jgi:hypothetical protein
MKNWLNLIERIWQELPEALSLVQAMLEWNPNRRITGKRLVEQLASLLIAQWRKVMCGLFERWRHPIIQQGERLCRFGGGKAESLPIVKSFKRGQTMVTPYERDAEIPIELEFRFNWKSGASLNTSPIIEVASNRRKLSRIRLF